MLASRLYDTLGAYSFMLYIYITTMHYRGRLESQFSRGAVMISSWKFPGGLALVLWCNESGLFV